MKAFLLTLLVTAACSFTHVLGADPPYEMLVLEATFDGMKPVTIAIRHGEEGEIAIGKRKEFGFGLVFHGRRLRLDESVDAEQLSNSDPRVQLVYEELEEPKASADSGTVTQASKKTTILINLDGKEKLIDLGDGKHLKLKATAVGAFRNKVEIEQEAAGPSATRSESK